MIWSRSTTADALNKRGEGSLSDHLGIHFTEVGDDFLKATMPVNSHTRQPMGIMHGGASCVLAETLGSVAANCCVDFDKHYCVGLDINTNHLRSIKEGTVFAKAIPFHIGRSTQVWSIEITNNDNKLISISRLTMAVLTR